MLIQTKHPLTAFKWFFLFFILEGLAALFYYFKIPSEKSGVFLLGLSRSRLAIAALLGLIILLAILLLVRVHIHAEQAERTLLRLDGFFTGNNSHLAVILTTAIVLLIFALELFFLTYILFPPFLRPLFLWAALTCLQVWLFLRRRYKRFLAQAPSLNQSIQTKWRSFSATQRRVFLAASILGLLYFCAFIPANALYWHAPVSSFYSGIDEVVQYPSVIRALSAGDTFSSTIYHVLVDESSIYGHPYVTLSALVLVPSRILFGAAFGDHVQLNLLLLRQFMNVLPIALSMFLLVYMATRFRSMWTSIPLYVLLLTIPGVIKYNIRFLHPDALVLLLVVLTIFFLQRDEFRFKRNFYLAAVTCALAAVIKLWGLFFFLAIVIYLITGLGRKLLTAKTMLLAGLGFILVMGATTLISDPGILVPSATQTLVSGLQKEMSARSTGYSDSAGATIYEKGLNAWLPYFKDYFLRPYFFFFCFVCLLACSWLGDQKLLARMLLGWCLVAGVYLVYFVAVKSYWYMMPLMVPLYISPFLLPALVRDQKGSVISAVLAKPAAVKLIWGVIVLVCGIQFAANLGLIATSPVILNYL